VSGSCPAFIFFALALVGEAVAFTADWEKNMMGPSNAKRALNVSERFRRPPMGTRPDVWLIS
jgi:hypothetical protein